LIIVEEKKRKVTLVICAGALWTIWKTRNDVAINKKVLSSHVVIIYKTITLIKTWHPLLKMKLKPTAEEMLDLISASPLVFSLYAKSLLA
jgi:hypothetical protein